MILLSSLARSLHTFPAFVRDCHTPNALSLRISLPIGVSLLGAVLGAGLLGIALPQANAQQSAAKPAPDRIVFANGDQLTGKFVRGVGDSVLFHSDMAGDITVPLAKIKELTVSGSFAVLRKNAPITHQHALTGPIQYTGDAIQISSSNPASTAPVEAVPVPQLAYIIDNASYDKEFNSRRNLLQGWNGTITAGATLVRSTQNGSTFNAGVALIRAIPTVPYLPSRNRTLFNLNESYGQLTQPVIPQTNPPSPDIVAKTNIFHTDAERDEYFSQRFYGLGQLSFDHNYSQGLNLQEVYGGGVGWTPILTPRQQLDVKADIHYEKQYFQDAANNQNLIGATIGENYLRHLPKNILFTESATILPAFNNANAYSANLAAGLNLPVYHRFSASFSTTDSYLNNPSAGYKKNSYQFVTGISYTLH